MLYRHNAAIGRDRNLVIWFIVSVVLMHMAVAQNANNDIYIHIYYAVLNSYRTADLSIRYLYAQIYISCSVLNGIVFEIIKYLLRFIGFLKSVSCIFFNEKINNILNYYSFSRLKK